MNDLASPKHEELSLLLDTGAGPRLEGRLARADGAELGVLCPPHPLFGGSMDNPVVVLIRDTLWELGLGTLRFNFRGVGQSEGSWGGGTGETEDLRGVVDLVERGDHGDAGIVLAGYSFGAWTAARISSGGFEPRRMILVSPPVDFLSFTGVELPDVPTLVAVGESDDLCSAAHLRSWLRAQPPRSAAPELCVVPGADHFWGAGLADLRDAIRGFLAAQR